MNISRINTSTNFKAYTSIKTPDKALNKEELSYLKNLGKNIGTDNDQIIISLTDMAKKDKDNKTYELTQKVLFENPKKSLNSKIYFPYEINGTKVEENTPLRLIETTLNSLKNLFA